MNRKAQRETLILQIAQFYLENKTTIREAAKYFGLSKTTIYNYFVDSLPEIDRMLANEVRILLNFNAKEKHLRGGQATKVKHSKITA